MEQTFNSITQNQVCQGSYEEKKSKFLCYAISINTKSEIDNFLLDLKKEHSKARHICYAYRLMENDTVYQKSSDDGEPSGTAGKPIMNLIEKNNLYNVLIAVVRYYGGIKLGAGNLLRAYLTATKNALENNIKEFELISKIIVKSDYSFYLNLKEVFDKNNLKYEMNFCDNSVEFCFSQKDEPIIIDLEKSFGVNFLMEKRQNLICKE